MKPDRISDDDHLKLNGFLNAWYVNVEELCGVEHTPSLTGLPLSRGELSGLRPSLSGCVRNGDGSYDIEMVIEFFPQRWFYLGLLISGITLFGCLGYLGWDWRRRWRKSKGSSQRH